MTRRDNALLWYGSVLGSGVTRIIDHASEGASALAANVLVTALGLGLVWLYQNFQVVRAGR